MMPFLIVGGVGVVLVLISLVLGDVFDSLDVGDGLLSATSLGVAAIVFGASGTLTLGGGLELVWAYVLAVVLALAAYALSALMVRNLKRSSDGVPASAIGLSGVARSDISPSGGEVSLDGTHEVERRLAYSAAPIAEGSRIRVVDQSGMRVKVEPE
ncbi:MAG TPA: NfeD family protein [Terrimesophilobacter sp.]|nr:NfeD family protein [Terrimesophilobacter sp.]